MCAAFISWKKRQLVRSRVEGLRSPSGCCIWYANSVFCFVLWRRIVREVQLKSIASTLKANGRWYKHVEGDIDDRDFVLG